MCWCTFLSVGVRDAPDPIKSPLLYQLTYPVEALYRVARHKVDVGDRVGAALKTSTAFHKFVTCPSDPEGPEGNADGHAIRKRTSDGLY